MQSLLPADLINWDHVVPFFNGADENICRGVFKTCNGFSIGRQFTCWGILTENPHTGNLLTSLNVPYCLRSNGYGSYPTHAPNAGYVVGTSMQDNEKTVCRAR